MSGVHQILKAPLGSPLVGDVGVSSEVCEELMTRGGELAWAAQEIMDISHEFQKLSDKITRFLNK